MRDFVWPPQDSVTQHCYHSIDRTKMRKRQQLNRIVTKWRVRIIGLAFAIGVAWAIFGNDISI